MNNVIKKIVLNLGEKEVSLTPGEAKKLKAALDEMFGKEVVEVVRQIHHHDHYPWRWYPLQPYYKYTTTGGVCTTYNSNNSTMTLSLSAA